MTKPDVFDVRIKPAYKIKRQQLYMYTAFFRVFMTYYLNDRKRHIKIKRRN